MAVSESDLSKALRLYDFVRFTFTDIHGIGRSRTVPRVNFEDAFSSGVGVFIGSMGLGLCGEVSAYMAVAATKSSDCAARVNGNVRAKPVAGTLHALPTSGAGRYKVGQVLCETNYAATGDVQTECPRYVARLALERLATLGYNFYGSVELEFVLVKEGSLEPVFYNKAEIFANLTFTLFEPVLLEVAATLEEMGVPVETLQTEYGGGSFELVLKPQTGIKIADNTFLAKDCVKEVARRHGFTAIFMTRYVDKILCNGAHFNHSLQQISPAGHVFSDVKRQDLLSDTFRHWMGGLMKHSTALSAVVCPTINCYRRFGAAYAPDVNNWGIEERTASFRVKTESPKATYVECRLPSGSSNSYLVLAAVISAGIDGLTNKTPCPLPSNESILSSTEKADYVSVTPDRNPRSLGTALDALGSDLALCGALGDHLVQWFSLLKREELRDYEQIQDEDAKWEWERDRYMYLL